MLPSNPAIYNTEVQILSDPKKMYFLKHILFGVSIDKIKAANKLSLDELINLSLNGHSSLPHLPLKDYNFIHTLSSDREVSSMSPWIGNYNYNNNVTLKRKGSLQKWIAGLLLENTFSIQPKMFLFWCNFFSVELQKLSYPKSAFNHYSQIFLQSLLNFKDMLVQLILEKTLAQYSRKIKPEDKNGNEYLVHLIFREHTFGENYEFFISKEKQKRLYRLLNKWDRLSDSILVFSKHRDSTRMFEIEEYLDKTSVKEYTDELSQYFDILLKNEAVALHVTKKIFRWFLHDEVGKNEMNNIIIPTANAFFKEKYNIRTLLKSFLQNDHFYECPPSSRAVKNPVEFIGSLLATCNANPNLGSDKVILYNYWNWIAQTSKELGQDITGPSGPEGWPAYYSQPYSKVWLSEEKISVRNDIVNKLLSTGYNIDTKVSIRIDPIQFIRSIPNAEDPDLLIHFLVQYFCGHLDEEVVYHLKCCYLLSDSEINEVWKDSYKLVSTDKGGETDELNKIKLNLTNLLHFLLTRREFHLI